jgi:uncharacterized protein YkwD
MGLLSFPDAARRSVRPLPVLRIRITGRKPFSSVQLRPTKAVVAGRRLILPLTLALAATLSAGASRAAADPTSNLLAPPGVCGPAADRLNLDLSTARKSMLCLTNYARVHSGLKRLVGNAMLNQAGEAKLDADLSCGEFTHTPCSKPFEVVFAAYLTGATAYALGENIAWGTGAFGTPRQTMNGWLHSSEHLQNILSPAFHQLGIGYLAGQTFQGATGATLWSQEFATRSPVVRHTSRSTPG